MGWLKNWVIKNLELHGLINGGIIHGGTYIWDFTVCSSCDFLEALLRGVEVL